MIRPRRPDAPQPDERPDDPTPVPVPPPTAADYAAEPLPSEVAADPAAGPHAGPDDVPVGDDAGLLERSDVDTAPLARERRRRPRRDVRPGRSRSAWPLVLPALLVVLVVTAWPIGRTVWLAARPSSLSVPGGDGGLGLDVLTGVLGSRTWWVAVSVTLLLVALAVLLQLLLASVVVAALRRVPLPRPLVALLLLAPYAVLPVASATVWRDALTSGHVAAWFGYDGDAVLPALVAVVGTEVWRGTGITALILLVGLRRVDHRLLDSAVADGATAWQRLRRVSWPAAAPAVAVAVVFRALDALRAFEAPLMAEPSTTLRTVPTLVWDATFTDLEVGLGAATSLLLLVLAAVVGGVLAALRPWRRA